MPSFLKSFQVLIGGIIIVGGVAAGVGTFVATKNITAAVTAGSALIGLGASIAGFTSQFKSSQPEKP